MPLPALILAVPPRPTDAGPDPTRRSPPFPKLVDPELKHSNPLDPTTPVFTVRADTIPLLYDVPSPLSTLRGPPEATALRPDNIWTTPPLELVPRPTDMIIQPVAPVLAGPVPNTHAPALPASLDPVENVKRPDVPRCLALVDRIETWPLLEIVVSPVDIVQGPPVPETLRPQRRQMFPPGPLVPLPAVINRDPACPDAAAVAASIQPLLPSLAVPELNVRRPVVPVYPPLEVRTTVVPLLDVAPAPLNFAQLPPVDVRLVPAHRINGPLWRLVPLPTMRLTTPPLPRLDAPLPA